MKSKATISAGRSGPKPSGISSSHNRPPHFRSPHHDILTGGSGSDTFDFSSLANGSDIITDFVTGIDDIDLVDLLDSAGLGSLDYATLIAQGNLIIQTGAFVTGTSTNSAATMDTRIYIDADGIGAGASVLVATLEDTLTNAGDFLV